ncbi:hypothetical protein PVAP13_6KG084440 [Panicum virgatum]|uniref:Uncharacterized protein n=1 Tax=Panicum virgatum TaxID=38727 RepID=A0A8T0RA67_PANVG|nr:hypothetical protein PVAP13_6KG084440 [Panicum virgatum]
MAVVPWPCRVSISVDAGRPAAPDLGYFAPRPPYFQVEVRGGAHGAPPAHGCCCCCCCGNRTPCGGSRARGCISASPSLFEMVGSMDMVPGFSCASSKRKGLLPMSIGYVKL